MMTYFHKIILIRALKVAQCTCSEEDHSMATTMVVNFGLRQATINFVVKKDKQLCPPCSVPMEFKQEHSYK